MLTFPRPADINGDLLAADLAAAGYATVVYATDGEVVLADLDESSRDAVRPIIDAHAAAAAAAAVRVGNERANEGDIRQQAAAALQSNRDFLALQSPTNAQVLAQVRALTRQNQGLIRLALRRFDGTD